MRIAQIAPCWLTIPPKGYGGVEAVVGLLTDGLARRGHDVTLFASGGSRTAAKLVTYFDEPPGTVRQVDNPLMELPHVLHAYELADDFELVHDHAYPFGPCLGALLDHPPVVHTIHNPPDSPHAGPVYELTDRRLHLVAVSHHQRRARPNIRFAATIHNGVAVEDFAFWRTKQDYLLFVGRMSPKKGVHIAVKAARMAGLRLIIACKMRELGEQEYFESMVRPLMDESITVLREVGYMEKIELYANAACTLVPLQWPEPFGLVMIESLASGTPVIAFRRGSAEEIIDHGVTGFLANDVEDFVTCIGRADSIDPWACRRAAETRFSAEKMVDEYEALYDSVLSGESLSGGTETILPAQGVADCGG